MNVTFELLTYKATCTGLAGPVGKELLKAAATEGLEAFRGGLEYAQAQAQAEQAAFRVR